MRAEMAIVLILHLLSPGEALSQSRRIVHDAGPQGRLAGPGAALRGLHEGGHEGAPIALSAAAAAIAALRARDWAAPPGDAPHPGVDAARLAACLIFSGHAAEARRLLRAAWPAGARGRAETERQLAARLACSPFAAAIRAVNPPGAPFTTARCHRNGPDQTAVHALNWR